METQNKELKELNEKLRLEIDALKEQLEKALYHKRRYFNRYFTRGSSFTCDRCAEIYDDDERLLCTGCEKEICDMCSSKCEDECKADIESLDRIDSEKDGWTVCGGSQN